MSRLIKFLFITVLTLILCGWVLTGYLIYSVASEVSEKGLKGIVQEVWCGKDEECELSSEYK